MTDKTSSFEKSFAVFDKLSSAAFLIQTNVNSTVVYANEAFYRLIRCTKEEFLYRYGNNLGAMTEDLSLKDFKSRLANQPEGTTFAMDQKIRQYRHPSFFIHTEATLIFDGEEPLLSCTAYDISDRKQLESELADYRNTTKRLAGLSSNEIFQFDLHSERARFYSAGPLLNQITEDDQKSYNGFLGSLISKGIVDPTFVETIQYAFRALRHEAQSVCELKVSLPDKSSHWYRLSLEIKQEHTEKAYNVLGVFQDITAQKEASLQYLNEAQFYQAILSEKTAYGHANITQDKLTRMGGMWNLYNELITKVTYTQLITEFINKVVHPEDRKHYLEVMQRQNFLDSLNSGIDRLGCQFRRIVEQNKMQWMELSVHLFRDPITKDVQALIYIQNIDEQKRRELKLLHDSVHDRMTNTYNRQAAEEEIRKRLLDARPSDCFAFLIVDVDNFKSINDNFGHIAGDSVLMKLSRTITSLFRKNDVVGRFGGDEFILFLENTGTRDSIERILTRLYDIIEAEGTPHLSCSIGVTTFQGEAPYDLIFDQADTALYVAKSKGKGQYAFYEKEMNESVIRHSVSASAPPLTPPASFLAEAACTVSLRDTIADEDEEFDQFISSQGDMAYLVNTDSYDLILGNTAFYDRIGLTKSQCSGMKCYEVMHKRETPCPFCSKAHWAHDKFYLWRNLNAALEQEFLIKNKLVSWHGNTVLLALAVDISNNKSILDSMDNSATESHSILGGIQQMMESETLDSAMSNALEIIGSFFHADAAQFWEKRNNTIYTCTYKWQKQGCLIKDPNSKKTKHAVNDWLRNREWNSPVVIESAEAMLCHSFEMYECMNDSSVRNQRWIPMKDGEKLLGILVIINISSNFQNISFMETFGGFMISEWKKRALVEGILYSNSHDDLTNLLSRSSYDQFLSSFDSDQVESIGVIMTDMNDLKGINGRRGFQMGDHCIKLFASMLQDIFTDYSVFRLNGDEFLVLASNIEPSMLIEMVTDLETRVLKDGRFSVSLGWAWDNIEKHLTDMIDQASQAMKVNKKRYYDSVHLSHDQERQTMLQELMTALDQRLFQVYLQPKINLTTGELIGAEALVRYYDDNVGLIPPAQFIDILERNNFIRYIDLFVFEEVCRLLQRWTNGGWTSPVISLNFSRLTLLEHDICASVNTIFSKFHIPKSRVEIEITESMGDVGKSILYQAAHDLYQDGFSISLDDFGTKYTNLAILSELDFDTLKLDKSLISALANQRDNQMILKNVIFMCKDLNIDVIAEGVETEAQEQILRTLGCTYGQGYLYGKPMPISEFEKKYYPPELKDKQD